MMDEFAAGGSETYRQVGPAEVITMCGGDALGDDPPPDAVLAFLDRLAECSQGLRPLARDVVRSEAETILKRSGVKAPHRLVTTAFQQNAESNKSRDAEKSGQGQELVLVRAEPWPDPVDGDQVVTALVETYLRYVAMPPECAVALALWVLHAWVHEILVISPILTIISPQPRCGKTTTLTITACLVPAPLYASSITAPALFRTVEAHYPTLLIDEADTFLGENEQLRGAINCGHAKTTAFVVRTVGDSHEPRLFSVWAPKAIAKIGGIPETIKDRSVVIELKRRAPDEPIERLRLDRLEDFAPLAQQAARWSVDYKDRIAEFLDPEVPAQLHDRAADNWRPLLAIADLAGGQWPEVARHAALTLSGHSDVEDLTSSTQLLADIRDIFDLSTPAADRIFSARLVAALVQRIDRPWPEWHNGRPLTERQLAMLLRPFGVQPRKIRIPDESPRQGYLRDDFTDAFRRYLPVRGTEQMEQPRNGAE